MDQENQNKASEPVPTLLQQEAAEQSKDRQQSQEVGAKHVQDQATTQPDEHDQELESIQKELQQITLTEPLNQENQESPKKQTDDDANQPQEYYTRDFIEINKNVINFTRSTLFPGSIDEVEISINLKEEALNQYEMPKEKYPLRVIALCNESKFNDLDEYVFSVRDNDRFEYFQEVTPMIGKNNRISVKVAVKIPAIKQAQLIEGTLSLQLLTAIPIFLNINARCQIPQVICLKELFDIEEGVGLIKIPAKKNMRMPPLPFKNLSAFNFMLEAETVSSSSFANRAYDVTVSSIVNCSANTPFFVNIQLKPNSNYRGATPKTDILRKVLVLKLKNSSVCFSYPIEVYVYQSTNGSSVS